jgi:heme a synthase
MSSAFPLSRRALSRVNACAALVLLVAGGAVTSTASGLAVPDWPLSYGQWMPPMVGGVFFEHGHRVIASLVGLLIVVMAVWTHRAEPRPEVRRLAWWTVFAVSLQGVLGGVTVLFGLPVAVSAAHATIGQTVFCLLLVMAELLGDPPPAAPGARRILPAAAETAAALWLQLLLGAVLRHGGAGLRWHLLGAAVAVLAAGRLIGFVLVNRIEPHLTRPASALGGLLGLQLALGTAAAGYRLRPYPRADWGMIAFSTAHLAVGAMLLGCAVILAFRLSREKAA